MAEQVYEEQVTVQATAEDVWLVLVDVGWWPGGQTLVLRQIGPFTGLARLLFGSLVRRDMRLEAEGLKREAERSAA